MLTRLFFILTCTSFLFCCRKEEPSVVLPAPAPAPGVHKPDTIKPGPYFPVWPGSHWTYVDRQGRERTDSASKSWAIHQYCFMGQPCRQTTPVVVPLLNNQPVYYHSMLYYFPSRDFHEQYSVVRTVPDNWFFYPPRCIPGEVCVIERQTVEQVGVGAGGDSLITVKGEFIRMPAGQPQGLDYRSIRIFRKNVGLIFHCKVDTLTKDTIFRYSLRNWHIAAH